MDFTCQIGDRIIKGLVKEKDEAKRVFKEAVDRGETASLLGQLPAASDVFTTTIGNVPPLAKVIITIRYNGELKHDAEVDGIRFTIPTTIAPRYGSNSGDFMDDAQTHCRNEGFQIIVDVIMAEGSPIQKIQSPSHPIAISIGTLSTAPSDDATVTKGSATLTLGTTVLEKDFVLQIVAKNLATPCAILETHPTIPNQRALMVTLVPKFTLKPQYPEIIFVADRSGSMQNNEQTLISALQVFLKSLPVGVKFNICSFGSSYEFLWEQSQAYSRESLEGAMNYVRLFKANFGGTDTFSALKAVIDRRFKDLPTEILLLTDGDIWDQETLFKYLNTEVAMSQHSLRVFTIGIGDGVSSALVEGVARAGNGFAQIVSNGERMDRKVVRMLKAALTPHITDYSLEVKYEDTNCGSGDEVVDRVVDSLKANLSLSEKSDEALARSDRKPISLYDTDVDLNAGDLDSDRSGFNSNIQDRKDLLPSISQPKLLQSPHKIPPLFPHSRTTVYLLMSPETSHMIPVSVTLKATSVQGPLELVIPVQGRETPGEAVHQLAARKAIQELEEGRGWITEATDKAGKLMREQYPGCFDEMVEREAVRLGVEFQVGGRWCSFVAVEANDAEIANTKSKVQENSGVEDYDFEMIEQDPRQGNLSPFNRSQLWEMAAVNPVSKAGMPSQARHNQDRGGQQQIAPQMMGSRFGGLRRSGGHKYFDSWEQTRGPATRGVPSQARHNQARGGQQQLAPQIMASRFGGRGRFGGHKTSDSVEQTRGPATRSGDIRFSYIPKSANDTDEDLVDFSDEDVDLRRRPGRFLSPDESPSPPKKMKTSAAKRISEQVELKGQALLHHLIKAQSFMGSWTLDSLPCDSMGVDCKALQTAVQTLASELGLGEERVAESLATAVLVSFLERRMGEEQEAWELVVGKATEWLGGEFEEDVMRKVLKVAGELVGVGRG